MRSAKAERIFTFSPIIVKNAGKKQAGNLLLRKKKISKIFREKVIFFTHNLPFFGRKSNFFLRFFEEILGALKRVYMMLLLNTEPRVSRKNVKKVTKKVLT